MRSGITNVLADQKLFSEHDLPYHMRVCIDKKIFAGHWYDVVSLDPKVRGPTIQPNTMIVEPYDPVVCAYDIETTKLPLKFPDSNIDQVISWSKKKTLALYV